LLKIQNFTEANYAYLTEKIEFRLLQDQAAVLIGLCEDPHSSVSNPLEITKADIEWLIKQPEATHNYDDFLGGAVYVCENEVDLLDIKGCDFKWAETHDGQWPNVTDIAMSWDACSYLDEIDDDPQWVIFLLCWNNAGGPIYYVPRHLWVQARVVEHIAAIN
jgi:hypothetical protein